MKRRDEKLAFVVAAALLCMTSGLLAQAQTPAQTVKQEVPNNPLKSAAPSQPIAFSHKSHLKDLQCESCHEGAAPGDLMGITATSTCMTCHADRSMASASKPDVKRLAEYDKAKKPVPWVRVYSIRPSHAPSERAEPYEKTGGVVWSHRSHSNAGITCEMCHGAVGEMEAMAETTSAATKGGCMSCHSTMSRSARKAKTTACTTCHAWFVDKTLG